MSKVKRNGPCPCGSGDKYKKCCGQLSGEEVTPERVHESLNEQYANFMDYVAEFHTHAAPSGKAKTKEKQMEEAFRMMNEVFLVRNKEQTVFDEYLEEKGLNSIPHPAKASVKEWTTLRPGLFEIQNIDSEQTAKVKEVFTSIVYDVKRDGIPLKDENIPKNPYVMGILMKWGWESNFIPLAIPNQSSFYESFRKLLDQGQDSLPQQVLEQNFMSYMKKWIHSDLYVGQDSEQVSSQGNQQVNVNEDDVLQLLGENISESIQQSPSYLDLNQLWSRYKNIKAPKYRKPSVFSAALEFLVTGTEYFDHFDKTITKKAVASKYGVSPSSMSRRLDELKKFKEEQ
jgi:uncharacterized protein